MIRARRLAFYMALLAIQAIVLIVLYAGVITYRSGGLYGYLKSNQRGWSGKAHKADGELGFAPIPGSEGTHVFPVGPDIAMRYDEDGFQVPGTSGIQARREKTSRTADPGLHIHP